MRKLAICNNKGGVGRTSTTIALADALAKKGKRVLLIDADPQGSLSEMVGRFEEEFSLFHVLRQDVACIRAIYPVEGFNGLVDIIPSNLNLVDLDFEGGFKLQNIFNTKHLKTYDYAIIDTAPSLGNLLIESLKATKYVLIPIPSEYLAVQGLRIIQRVIQLVRNETKVVVLGAVVTNHDARTTNAREMVSFINDELAKKNKNILETIPRTVAVPESSIVGSSVISYAPQNPAAEAYINLTNKIVRMINQMEG